MTYRSNPCPELTDEEVEAAITAVRGFGRWSAHMYMMFSLGRPTFGPAVILRCGWGLAG
ncbi:MAG: hypothetical protein CM15mP74_03930 [Halieaceae bacterium]|nr:MAG: hypothetical protein CM15mP74_03930 [Halieaceae bacterium]